MPNLSACCWDSQSLSFLRFSFFVYVSFFRKKNEWRSETVQWYKGYHTAVHIYFLHCHNSWGWTPTNVLLRTRNGDDNVEILSRWIVDDDDNIASEMRSLLLLMLFSWRWWLCGCGGYIIFGYIIRNILYLHEWNEVVYNMHVFMRIWCCLLL